ncbi:MAG: lactoylglutathione lyase [Bermanella sp.]
MRILHTMLRVVDLDKSIQFYQEIMGMNLLRRRDNEQYRYTLAFMGYGDESHECVIELTHNWDTNEYQMGDAYGHIAIGCNDIYATCKAIAQAGGTVSRQPGPVKGGATEIAFVKDPDGYAIELIQLKNESSEKI